MECQLALFLFLYLDLVYYFKLLSKIVNETAPTELKGPLGTITQILITVGIMISFFLGLPIPDLSPGSISRESQDFLVRGYWRVMFALPILFALIQIGLLVSVFNYETPKYLKSKRRFAELQKLMVKIYGSNSA